MNTSIALKWRSIVGKIMMGLALAAMIGSLDVGPALGKDDHKSMGKHDNGRYEHNKRGYERGRSVHGRRDYQPYGYAPPPIVYAPPPLPGINIFIPIHF